MAGLASTEPPLQPEGLQLSSINFEEDQLSSDGEMQVVERTRTLRRQRSVSFAADPLAVHILPKSISLNELNPSERVRKDFSGNVVPMVVSSPSGDGVSSTSSAGLHTSSNSNSSISTNPPVSIPGAISQFRILNQVLIQVPI